jgi:hypothetical protein
MESIFSGKTYINHTTAGVMQSFLKAWTENRVRSFFQQCTKETYTQKETVIIVKYYPSINQRGEGAEWSYRMRLKLILLRVSKKLTGLAT